MCLEMLIWWVEHDVAIVSAREILLDATRRRYAVGAFNITNIVQMEAVIEAAEHRAAPVIIQTSVAPARLLGVKVIAAVCRSLAESASIPICLHLDHCTDIELCKAAADAGYTNIMIDGSKQDFEENVRQTRLVAEYCHNLGDITVEGELGTVSGVEDQVKVAEDEAALCDPNRAQEFVERTGIDLFAPAIGTAHGVYRTKNPKLDFDRFDRVFRIINGASPRIPLVIHGGTGLQDNVVRRLVALGGAKFNVSTELKHTLIDATYDYIGAHRDEYDPAKIDLAVKKAISRTIDRWIDVLGCGGKAL
jgi:tagatose 1,6-diphosphate aldolase GatY/KbaY